MEVFKMQFDFLFPPNLAVVLPVMIPIITALFLTLVSESIGLAKKRVPHSVLAALASLGFALTLMSVYSLAQHVWADGVQVFTWGGLGGPLGVVLAADMFSIILMGLFSLMGFVVSVYSLGYMNKDTGLPQYYMLLLIMVGAMNGVVVAGDLFTLFMFYETMGLSSFILVAFRRNWEGIEAAIKYLMMSAIGSTLVLYSASFLYGLTGTLNLASMAVAIQADPTNPLLPILVAMLTAGFGVKGAVVPFAAWLADAHPAAPSGISAMLSGVVIKVGIYGILRVDTMLFSSGSTLVHGIEVLITSINWPLLLGVFAVITMTAGNFYALTQNDLKRMLAYSSITQIGFILFAFGTATPFGYESGTLYIVSHAFTKGLLFLCAGAFLHAIGSRDLRDLSGIAKKMPVTAGFFTIGLLSLMGMPPTLGFYAKFLILYAGVQAGLATSSYYLIFAVIAILNALVGLGYYLRMLNFVWFRPISEKGVHAHKSSPSMIFAMGLLALAIIVLGIYPAPIYTIAEAAGNALFHFNDLVSGILSVASP